MLFKRKRKYKRKGTYDICETNVTFVSESTWFRGNLFCSGCESVPRERALTRVIKRFFPNFTNSVIHERHLLAEEYVPAWRESADITPSPTISLIHPWAKSMADLMPVAKTLNT